MELRAEQARMLATVGLGQATRILEELMDRVALLCGRCADAGRFADVDDYAQWGKALNHAIEEIRERHGAAAHLGEIAQWIETLMHVRSERGLVVPAWYEELQSEIERLERGGTLPADRDPIRLRAGLVLATQEIARLKCEQQRDESGEDFDEDEALRLGGAEEMREIMLRVAAGETGV